MEEQIISMYRNAGYEPKDMVNELIGLVGCSILSLNKDVAEYSNDKFSVEIKVTESKE